MRIFDSAFSKSSDRPISFSPLGLAILVLAATLVTVRPVCAALPIAAASQPGGEWRAYPTRTLDDLPPLPANTNFDQYGGWTDHREKATGYFHTARLNGRWWLIDPEGALFLHIGVATVQALNTPGARAALSQKFGDRAGWANGTAKLLRDHGFNGTGGGCASDFLVPTQPPLVSTCLLSFMGSYAHIRGGTYRQPGHLGYPRNCIFVFDPQFETFCDQYASQLTNYATNPWLLGYFSDNEMPFPTNGLANSLLLPDNDPGHQAALQFLRSRHGPAADSHDITGADRYAFLRLVADRYFCTVSRAIKKYDPNHLYLGARFYGNDFYHRELYEACGPYVDVISINYYYAWTPTSDLLNMWAAASDRPVLISEWYAKGEDSGMSNTSGAGWLVKTQRDRGAFYQNYALGLLASKVCVGWHWFKYTDNDPEDKSNDPSDLDSNKGIVTDRYVPYTILLDAMKSLNDRIYSLTDYFDHSGNDTATTN